MLPFQRTTLYQQTLSVIEEILQSLPPTGARGSTSSNQIITDTCHHLIQNVAKGFLEEGQNREEYFKKASHQLIEILISLDVAEKKHEIKNDKKKSISSKITKLQDEIINFPHKQKRVLILSAAMGQGHMSAARALAEGFQEQFGYDYNVEIVDFMELLSSFINTVSKKSYEGAVKFMPAIYKIFYETTNKRVQILKLLNQFNYPFVLSRIKKFFEEKKPDLLISTFPIWNYLAFEICQKSFADVKLATIVTDSITVHNSWVMAESDFYIVANEDTQDSLLELGVPKEKVKVLGFPVRLDFLKPFDRKKFIQDLGLDSKKFTVLFLPTSQNLRKNEKIIHELLSSQQKHNIIVITGRDTKLYPKLQKTFAEDNIKIVSWTNEMPHFIQSADVIVTKAGGAIIMECIAAAKPMVITSIIPGQEQGNADLIKKYHLGLLAHTTSADISEQVEYVRKNLGMFQKNLNKVNRPQAAIDIAKFLHGVMK